MISNVSIVYRQSPEKSYDSTVKGDIISSDSNAQNLLLKSTQG